jgi:transcriptional regulator with XRE-family HTH domain
MYPNLKLQIFRLRVHQNQLAKALGLNETVLSKVICGYREPSESLKKTLANYLGVDEGWLFEKYENTAVSRLGDGNTMGLQPPVSGGKEDV